MEYFLHLIVQNIQCLLCIYTKEINKGIYTKYINN